MPDTNPLWGLSGPAFLVIYIVAALAAAIGGYTALGALKRGTKRGDPRAGGPVIPEELGYLRRGRPGVVDVAVARLLEHDGLRASRRGHLTATDLAPASDLDAAVLYAARRGGRLRSLVESVEDLPAVLAVEDRLVARGWAVAPDVVRRRILRSTLPLVGVGVIGLIRVAAGSAVHHPIENLVIALFVTALVVYQMLKRPRFLTTTAGQEALSQGRTALNAGAGHSERPAAAWLHPAVMGAAGAVAVGGLFAYPDAGVRDLIAPSGGGGWSSGGGGGGCGGGGGGGGCGGGGGGCGG